MNRMRVASVHKILQISALAALLFCAPLQLTAQEREPRAADHQSSAIERISSLWNDLAAWLTGAFPSPPPSPDGACSIDPWGGCPGS
jgi:hypothetical protein